MGGSSAAPPPSGAAGGIERLRLRFASVERAGEICRLLEQGRTRALAARHARSASAPTLMRPADDGAATAVAASSRKPNRRPSLVERLTGSTW